MRIPARKRIDYSDIPEASAEQLSSMRRVGRPTLGDTARQVIAIRVDLGVLDEFKRRAKRQNIGYQTLMHQALSAYVKRVG